MKREDILAFLAVKEYGSISRAAEKLFVRQTTLSGRIQNLETELAMQLFRRGKGLRNAELTDFGRDFVALAEKWEQLWQETLSAAGKKQNRSLCTAAVHSANAYIMTEVYSLFAARFPAVRMRLMTRLSDEAYHAIENDEAEAAFINKPQYSKKVEAIALFSEKMQLVCNQTYQTGESVHPTALDASKEILLSWHREYMQWHEHWFGENSAPRVLTDDMMVMEKFIQTESCWSITPTSVAHALGQFDCIRIRSLEEAPPDRMMYLIKLKKAKMSAELTALLEIIRQVVERQGAEWVY